MKNFADRLIEAIEKKGNPICMGLDPRLDQIPEFIRTKWSEEKGFTMEAVANAIVEFNKGLIDATFDIVPVVKPQIAFYEMFGFEGVWAFEETVNYAKDKGMLVIADAKRNDIGSTAEAYAKAFLGQVDLFGGKYFSIDADALTVTPYLGSDGINPFVKECADHGKGIFVLVKTSNPSSGDLQGRFVKDENCSVHELMGGFVESWGADLIGESGYSSVGAVVGATFPKEAEALREIMPEAIFLVPGFGAQGGAAEDVKPCFNKDGLGAIINNSRGLNFAYQKDDRYEEKDYAEACRDAVIKMAGQLQKVGIGGRK